MTKDWTYGDAGDRYPVKAGDIWRVGDHVLACGDLERGSGSDLREWLGEPLSMAYVDPPWTPSLLTGFRTKAGLARGLDFANFCRALVEELRQVSGDVYVEMGFQFQQALADLLKSAGATVHHRWDITYYQKKPATLMLARWTARDLASHVPPMAGLDDTVTPEHAIESSSVPNEWVYDPCVGRGLTALTADTLGRRCLGLELHPRRLAVSLDLLSQRHAPAEKVGEVKTMLR